MLQSQLGLLSTPVEHEQVSVVSAAEPRENAPQNADLPAEEPHVEVPSAQQEQETVAVNINLPETSEDNNDSWDSSPLQDADDLFGFGDLGESDIPKNAFGKREKAKPSRETKPAAVPRVEETSQDVFDEPVFASEDLSTKNIPVHDPLMSDELPTSLWQPRKPAPSAAKSRPETPSFSGDALSRSDAVTQDRKADPRERDAETMPGDDLAQHSSGRKRRDRGRGRSERSDDRPSREPSDRDRRDDSRREDSRREPDNQRNRGRRDATPQKSFRDDAFDTDSGFVAADSRNELPQDDLGWEPRPSKHRGDRKPGKPSFRSEDTSPVFADRDDDRRKTEAASPNRDAGDSGQDWFDGGAEREEKSEDRPSRRNRNRRSPDEARRSEPEKDTRNDCGRDESSPRRSRGERDRESSRQPAAPPAPRRSESSASGAPSQKIAVPSWDDAVRDIIEKNMQSHPPRGERRNNGGGRGRRR